MYRNEKKKKKLVSGVARNITDQLQSAAFLIKTGIG